MDLDWNVICFLQTCDCGIPPEVTRQRAEISRLRALLAEARVALEKAKANFEAMDTGMRTEGVPIDIAQSAFDCGMRYLVEGIAKLDREGVGK